MSISTPPPLTVTVRQPPALSITTTDQPPAIPLLSPGVRSGSSDPDRGASSSLIAEDAPSVLKLGPQQSELRQAVEQASVEQLVRLVGPKIAQKFSLWDFLMLRCSTAAPPIALIAELVEEYLDFVKHVQPFFADCLRPLETVECSVESQPRLPDSPQLRPSNSSDLDGGPNESPPATPGSNLSLAVDGDATSSSAHHPFLDNKMPRLRCSGGRLRSGSSSINSNLLETQRGLMEPQINSSILDSKSYAKQQDCGSPPNNSNDHNYNEGFNLPCPSPIPDGLLPSSSDCFFEVQNPEQAAALALPIGRYAVSPLRAPFKRHRPSVSDGLSEVAGGTQSVDETEGAAETTQPMALLSGSDAKHAAKSSPNSAGSPNPAFTLLNEGLGKPIDDSLLANGDFLPLTSTICADLPVDLVLEAATGHIFHRPTGRLAAPLTEAGQATGLASEHDATGGPIHCNDAAEIPRLPLYVTVQALSPTSSLIVRSDGVSFKVDHDGEGVSQDAIATILEMNGLCVFSSNSN